MLSGQFPVKSGQRMRLCSNDDEQDNEAGSYRAVIAIGLLTRRKAARLSGCMRWWPVSGPSSPAQVRSCRRRSVGVCHDLLPIKHIRLCRGLPRLSCQAGDFPPAADQGVVAQRLLRTVAQVADAIEAVGQVALSLRVGAHMGHDVRGGRISPLLVDPYQVVRGLPYRPARVCLRVPVLGQLSRSEQAYLAPPDVRMPASTIPATLVFLAVN